MTGQGHQPALAVPMAFGPTKLAERLGDGTVSVEGRFARGGLCCAGTGRDRWTVDEPPIA
ncbi:MAG: hypothetical protein M3301_05575 [Chloroflexota bacterium]|nr:hypothetical protein [Chloroflexota bacterium]